FRVHLPHTSLPDLVTSLSAAFTTATRATATATPSTTFSMVFIRQPPLLKISAPPLGRRRDLPARRPGVCQMERVYWPPPRQATTDSAAGARFPLFVGQNVARRGAA